MKHGLSNKKRTGSVRNLYTGRRQAAEHDQLMDCIQHECGGFVPHKHDKPLLTEGWVKAIIVSLSAALIVFSMVGAYYATHHDDSESYSYKVESKALPGK